MKLLFRRSQTAGKVSKIQFQLWGKVELDLDEQALVRKYKFDEAILIGVSQDKLIRNSVIVGIFGAIASYIVLSLVGLAHPALALIAGGAAGYFYFHQKRETIFVKDLIHGRYFSCNSVVELAQKEDMLRRVVSIFRQIMEGAKHWDGTETIDIPVLDKEAARILIGKL